MIIAQISDTHIALDTPDARQRLADFEQTIADINALYPAPNAIFHTGDLVHNGRQDEYAEAMRILADAKPPVYAIPGNKDDRANLIGVAAGGFVEPDSDFIEYAIEGPQIRLIAVDTKCVNSNRGGFCPARARRLGERIDAERTKPIAVFTHHPPFEVTEGPDRFHFETPEAMSRLSEVLQFSGRVVAVFSGHVHRGVVGHVGRIPASVAPCVATALRMGAYPAHLKARPVYHLHRFVPECGFFTEARIVGTA